MSTGIPQEGVPQGSMDEAGGLPGGIRGNIYMDYNGSTPVDPEIRDVMIDAMTCVTV